MIESFSEPLHPVLGGVASGGGLGVGIGYTTPETKRWFHDASAMVTVRRYWLFEGETGRRFSAGRSQAGVFVELRDMNSLNYFGIGPQSRGDDRSTFRLHETTFGVRGRHRVSPLLRVGGSASMYLPDTGPGRHATAPSIEKLFNPSTIPGFSAEPRFGRYRGYAEITYPISPEDPVEEDSIERYRGTYQFAVEAVRDHESGRHSFHRWETEVQQRFPGLRSGQRLTLHGLMVVTDPDADVPFYMMYALGGGGLKSFRPELMGSDGTTKTLRAFKNYRFRDRDLVLMQAEYRIPLRDFVHATVFVDAGQVAPRASGLFKDLRTGTGFSLSYVRKGKALGRMEIGYGGGEGLHVFWNFGVFGS